MTLTETLKNAFHGIFQPASSRYLLLRGGVLPARGAGRFPGRCALMLVLCGLAAGPAGAVEPAREPPPPPAEPAQALRGLQREHAALLAQQPALQEAAARSAQLSEQNRQLEQQLELLQAQVDGLREEAATLHAQDRRRWFVTGAAVLGAGVLAGLILASLGRRSRRGRGGFR